MNKKTKLYKNHIQMIWVIFLLACFSKNLCAEGENRRLWMEASINGKPVKMIFDTGAEVSMLFRHTAEHVGLKFTNARSGIKVPKGEIAPAWTGLTEVALKNQKISLAFAVVDLPEGITTDVEGVFGYGDFKNNVFHIDVKNLQVEPMKKTPKAATKWSRFRLKRDAKVLLLLSPNDRTGKKNVLLDTGSDSGASLGQEKWNLWTSNHPNYSRTIGAYYTPSAGLIIDEISWADEISLGSLILENVTVQKTYVISHNMGGDDLLSVLGLRSLEQFDIIVDGKKGFIYLQQKTIKSAPDHNRTGVVFTPDNLQGDERKAHALIGTPAYEAGIRDGDFLMAVEGVTTKEWVTNTSIPSFSDGEPGTKVHLKLKRGEKEFDATVVLRNLIGPDVKPSPQKASPN